MVKNFKTSQYRDVLIDMFMSSDAEYFLTINPDPRLYLNRLNFKDNRAKLALSKKEIFQYLRRVQTLLFGRGYMRKCRSGREENQLILQGTAEFKSNVPHYHLLMSDPSRSSTKGNRFDRIRQALVTALEGMKFHFLNIQAIDFQPIDKQTKNRLVGYITKDIEKTRYAVKRHSYDDNHNDALVMFHFNGYV